MKTAAQASIDAEDASRQLLQTGKKIGLLNAHDAHEMIIRKPAWQTSESRDHMP